MISLLHGRKFILKRPESILHEQKKWKEQRAALLFYDGPRALLLASLRLSDEAFRTLFSSLLQHVLCARLLCVGGRRPAPMTDEKSF